jgi:hypothetical protein
MAFEKITLAVAEDCGIENAYFAHGTMWIPCRGTDMDTLLAFQKIYPDTIFNIVDGEFAVDFVGPNQGKTIDRWSFVTI